MRLNKISQYNIESCQLDAFDLIIACCGYEDRCVSLLKSQSMQISKIPNKAAIVYNTPDSDNTLRNKDLLKDSGFRLFHVNPTASLPSRLKIIDDLFDSIKAYDRKCKVLIDYSSMNREWYSAILLYIEHTLFDQCSAVDCWFYYSIPVYDGYVDKKYSFSSIRPLDGYSSFLMPDKPLSLLVGLGSEERALTGIKQYADVDSKYVHYFYTNNEHIFSQNKSYKSLFENIKDNNKHEYDLNRMIPLFNIMSDLYKMLSHDFRVAMISCGPKPFTLLSLVFARLYNVDVWKLETNYYDHETQKIPSGKSVVLGFEYSI